MTVDETPSAALTASVMDELRVDARPPQDEYASDEPPPAYETFEEAYAQWRVADNAKQAIVAFDKDPAVAAAEKELKEAKAMLQDMKEKSEAAFKALHTKRSPFASLFSFGKSKRISLQDKTARNDSSLASTANEINDGTGDVSQLDVKGSTSTTGGPPHADGNPRAAEEFRRAREAEMKQDLVVQVLEDKVAEFKQQREALSKVASPRNLAWIQLRRVADETLLSTPEFATGMGALMEKLEGVENAYNVAKKTTTDIARASLAAGSSHSYFKHALKICDGIRGTSMGRGMLGGIGGGIGEMDKMMQYRESVTLASKAQICLNEMFRVLEPHEHMIPDDRMKDYKELKKIGVMQISKIYNLMFGGNALTDGVSGSVKLMLERQETAFAHLTYLGVWVQNREPVCMVEEDMALTSRDDVRREVATFWNTSGNGSGQAETEEPQMK